MSLIPSSLLPFREDYLLFGIIVGGTLAAGFLFWIVTWRREKKRTEELRTIARMHGLRFDDKASAEFILPEHLELFGKGYSKRTANILQGRRGAREWTILDYRYTVGGGKSQQTYNQTVFLTTAELPAFHLATEGFLDRLAAMVGYDDIDFDSNQEFSKRYCLKSSDQRIRTLFSPEVLSFFVRERVTYTIESQAGKLEFHIPNTRVAPAELMTWLTVVERIADMLTRTR